MVDNLTDQFEPAMHLPFEIARGVFDFTKRRQGKQAIVSSTPVPSIYVSLDGLGEIFSGTISQLPTHRCARRPLPLTTDAGLLRDSLHHSNASGV